MSSRMDTPADPPSSGTAAGAERRRTPRADVRITMSGQASSSRVRLANVSEGGCLVYASCLLNAGDTHLLRFKSENGEELRLHARVVHALEVSGDPETACVAGLEFMGDDSALQRAAVDRLLTLSSSSQP